MQAPPAGELHRPHNSIVLHPSYRYVNPLLYIHNQREEKEKEDWPSRTGMYNRSWISFLDLFPLHFF